MAREIMHFVQSLGGLYGDNEPTIRSLLRILLNSRHSMGLRTRKERFCRQCSGRECHWPGTKPCAHVDG